MIFTGGHFSSYERMMKDSDRSRYGLADPIVMGPWPNPRPNGNRHEKTKVGNQARHRKKIPDPDTSVWHSWEETDGHVFAAPNFRKYREPP